MDFLDYYDMVYLMTASLLVLVSLYRWAQLGTSLGIFLVYLSAAIVAPTIYENWPIAYFPFITVLCAWGATFIAATGVTEINQKIVAYGLASAALLALIRFTSYLYGWRFISFYTEAMIMIDAVIMGAAFYPHLRIRK